MKNVGHVFLWSSWYDVQKALTFIGIKHIVCRLRQYTFTVHCYVCVRTTEVTRYDL